MLTALTHMHVLRGPNTWLLGSLPNTTGLTCPRQALMPSEKGAKRFTRRSPSATSLPLLLLGMYPQSRLSSQRSCDQARAAARAGRAQVDCVSVKKALWDLSERHQPLNPV